jgi:hypothetical protein
VKCNLVNGRPPIAVSASPRRWRRRLAPLRRDARARPHAAHIRHGAALRDAHWPRRRRVAALRSKSRRRAVEPTRAVDVVSAGNMNVPLGATMPLSRYKTADASLMEAMRKAFHQLCDILQLSCDREDQLTEVVVTKIVALAKGGERDPEKLCNAVLAELEIPAKGMTSDARPQPMMAHEADGR